jgi:hypothetical protein
METVKKTKEHTIVKKRSGRYGIQTSNGKWINGDDKLAILTAEGLVTAPAKKAPPVEEPAAEEAAPEAAAAETSE